MQVCLQLLRTHLWRSQSTPRWHFTAMARSLCRTSSLYQFSSSLSTLLHTLIVLGRLLHLAIPRHHPGQHTAALDNLFIRTNPNQRLLYSAGRLLVGPVTYRLSLPGRGAPTLFQTLRTKRAGGMSWFRNLDLIWFFPLKICSCSILKVTPRRYDDMKIWNLSDLGVRAYGVASFWIGSLLYRYPHGFVCCERVASERGCLYRGVF